jgi:metallophosphoesterase (TIGR03767 family)
MVRSPRLRRARLAAGIGLGICSLLAAGGVAWPASDTDGKTTLQQRIVRSPGAGFRPLQAAPGEGRLVRRGGLGTPQPGRSRRRFSIFYFGQLSDFQLADEESPARVEFLDGSADPAPVDAAWRPWEAMEPQVDEMAIRQVNRFAAASPVTQRRGRRARMALAITTGDSADNQEKNEAQWVVRLLEGGTLTPNSGLSDSSRYDPFCRAQAMLGLLNAGDAPNYTGVQDFRDYAEGTDPAFYDPNDPRGTRYGGFPKYPGLLDRAQQPFHAEGLRVPSYVAFGNHDGLVQGNQAANKSFDDVAVGCIKTLTPIGNPRDLGGVIQSITPQSLQALFMSDPTKVMLVPPDPSRTFVSKAQYKSLHATPAQPDAHGFGFIDRGQLAASGGAAGYYSWSPKRGMRFIALDTLSEGGITGPSADGNIDDPQFRWLEGELKKATRRDELVVLFGHHAINSLTANVPDEAAPPCTGNDPSRGHDRNPGCDVDPRNSQPVHLGADLVSLLHKYPHAAAFVAGHSHLNQILPYPKRGGGGFWNVKLAAEADWPQQSGLLEFMDNRDGTLSLFNTILNHASPVAAPAFGTPSGGLGVPAMGSIARMLSANDPQKGAPNGEGASQDRNVELLVRDPRRNPLDEFGRRCANVRGKIKGKRVHRVRLSMKRRKVRRQYSRSSRKTRRQFDYFCLSDGKAVRVGYPGKKFRKRLRPRQRRRVRGRASEILTSSRHLSVKRIRPGSSVRRMHRRLRGERRFRIGKNTYYIASARRARLVFRTRKGRVRAVGLADKRLTRGRKRARRFLRGFR